jgi:hypothetical protein
MRKLILSIYFTLNLIAFASAQICTNGPNTIGGISFTDFNENGVKDVNETVQSGIQVSVFDLTGALVQSATTDVGGNWSITVATPPSLTVKYRVEFSISSALTAAGLHPSANGTGNRTSVQFVSAASCSVNFGVNYATDYCQPNPPIAIPCYEPGNLVYGPSGNTNKGLVTIPYNSSGATPTGITGVAGLNEIGTVWGMGYQTARKRLFASTFLKRHSGLGPLGMGGVYVVSFTGASSGLLTNSFDLQGVTPANGGAAIDLGSVTRTGSADYILPDDNLNPSIDLDAFAKIGKAGFGGTEVGPDGNTLWLVNLNQRALISVDITDTLNYNGTVKQYLLSDFTNLPTCANGVLRPWGLKMHNGRGYLGCVCDASTSQSATDLVAYVLSFDPANPTTFTVETTFNLDYLREKATDFPAFGVTEDATWNAWADTWAQTNIGLTPNSEEAYAQPILSDIDFSDNGSMILAFADRFGHQAGYQQYIAVASAATIFSVNGAGDMIHVCNVNGVWKLEGATGCAVNDATPAESALNNDGVSGTGEFYYGDHFNDPLQSPVFNHNETSMGALAVLKGSNEVMSINVDPVDGANFAYDQGFVWYNTTTGARNDQFRLIDAGPASNKGNGLGDIEAICAPAPIEIGNYVWIDTDRDGVQDPNEGPLSNVTVKLYKMGTATAIASTTTNSDGEFYFKDYYEFGNGYDTLTLGAMYFVVIGEGGQWSTANKSLTLSGVDYVSSVQNTTANGGNELNDNDAFVLNDVTKSFNGYLVDTLTIPSNGAGYVNHDLDFGLFICPTVNTPSANQTICNGSTAGPLSIETSTNATDAIKFVYFTSDQIAGATPTAGELLTIYTTGTALSMVTPTGGAAPFAASFTPTATTFVNNGTTPVTYYVYALLNPDLGAACRPLAEILVTVNPTVTAGTLAAPSPFCQVGSNAAVLNLGDYLTNESNGGAWTDVSAVSAGVRFDVLTGLLNINGLGIGVYTFRYSVTGIAPCPNDSKDLTITIQQCCPPNVVCLPVSIMKN